MSLFKNESDYSYLPEVPEDKWWCPHCKKFIDPCEATDFEKEREFHCPDCGGFLNDGE